MDGICLGQVPSFFIILYRGKCMIITHNMGAMNASRMYGMVTTSRAKSTEKLSSGYRINRSADDAAGLSISEKMRFLIKGLSRGSNNTEDGISMVQVADGALNEISDMFNRLEELAVQAANGTLTQSDRRAIQDEVDQIKIEIDRITKTTKFNELNLFTRTEQADSGAKNYLARSRAYTLDGHLTEVYYSAKENSWYPSASLDFNTINADNMLQLAGKYFSFTDTSGSGESTRIEFTTGNKSSATGLDSKEHVYYVGIENATSGSDVVTRISEAIKNNPPTYGGQTARGDADDGYSASTSNNVKSYGTRLIIYSHADECATEAEARSKYNANSGIKGQLDFHNITDTKPVVEKQVPIQCSSIVGDALVVRVREVSLGMLGIDDLDMLTQDDARWSIDKISNGQAYISSVRSELGAYQNQLEHTQASLNNTEENTQASESRIRDTNMADEMVKNTKDSILIQAGQAMIAQANQQTQGVMMLLQA